MGYPFGLQRAWLRYHKRAVPAAALASSEIT